MRQTGYRPIFAVAAAWMALSGLAAAQPGLDQISVVIPAVEKRSTNLTDADAALISYILAQSMKRYFLRSEGSNRSSVVIVPAPVPDDKPATLAKLAKINGAQIALSLKAFRQKKGVLIDIVMVIPEPYPDFRTDPLEALSLDFKGLNLRLDVPSKYMSFPALFLTNATIDLYRADTYRRLCPINRCDSDVTPKITGPCKILGRDIPFSTPTRYYEMAHTEAIMRLEDTCYLQKMPATPPVSQPVIDFITGVERFFAGDRADAKGHMNAVIAGMANKNSNLVLQAYLYLARLSIQMKNLKDARQYTSSALAINSKDPSVLDTYRFLQFSLLARAVEDQSPDATTLIADIEKDLGAQPKTISRPYEAMLNRLRTEASKRK
jgi:hypothetical protein